MAVSKIMAAVVLLCLIVAAPFASAAITCSSVAKALGPCIDYAKGNGATPPPVPCCSGIRALNSEATGTPERQATCKCLKSLAGGTPNLNMGTVASVPGKCGVSIPYKISLSTDCDSVK